ncbi:MAG: TonB-dependent siderophore receptor [Oscillatoriales cyanobacterium]|nr:TonB-dependent siderophore receptor [Microcoleus sp. PH2017_05_CCC_O_A]MCC3583543.1 TonB-dependent siderophore receptor [Microcoleus sp. PH2017_30_WIL_O_A]TAG08058.1 MAG: TonB-dependent siderophore receptor [Oscillatoriales cyanobacterium]TAG17505.1 MAG: TonB-dependent siderophore receptor [Oscillatoriales cyanobacterium]TAG45614.1 MAG: TonB-dependent siderophore receptor [Oscillatoriales cyanobacterium]
MCGVKMKLYLPLACVALLNIGIGPSVASQAAIEDLTEASRSSSLAHGSIEIHSESEELPQQESAIATGLQPELPIQVKSLITSQKLETKQTVADDDRQPNPQLTQNISDNDDRSTSISHSPPIEAQRQVPIAEIPQLREIEQPSTSAQGLLRPSVRSFRSLDDTVQISQSVVQVTGVRLNAIASGLEVILETPEGQVLQATTRIEGKSAIADIENAQLVLPSGGEFRESNPDEGIASVTVTQLEGSRIRVSVTGIKAAPEASVVKSDRGLVLGVTPSAKEDIKIIVTATQATPYRNPNASSATRTETPTRDIPQSIQIVPQEVIEDQQVVRLEEALSNVSGVTFGGEATGRNITFGLRGFNDAPILRDGFVRYGSQSIPEVANLDRVEVLKGPASILYGEIQPGGLINLVSKEPLSEPFYEAELQLGNQSFIRPRIDISGPLTSDRSLLYRLNAAYQTSDSYRGFTQDNQRLSIAPTLAWRIGDRADLTVSLEYIDDKRAADNGLPVIGRRVVDVPRDRVSSDPDDAIETQDFNVGYKFEYRFSDNWKLRNAFRYASYNFDFNVIGLQELGFNEETGTTDLFWASQDSQNKNYTLQTNIVGNFATGSVQHTLIFGADIAYSDVRTFTVGDFETPAPVNIFNPVYRPIPKPDEDTLALFSETNVKTYRYGFYVQDQISIFDNLKLLAGIRYDTAEQRNDSGEESETTKNYDDFTPRIGIVYQPIPELSFYASYSRSFNPGSATTAGGSPIEPETGSGYEVGVKAELLDRRLAATLAYFDITKQNVAVTDPNNSLFSIASGEQQSRGVELDISGQILPGWNIIAAYAYTDAEVTADTDRDVVGNRLFNVPKHSGSLWTTYQIQSGDLQGLGFGLGFSYVGERQGDLANSFEVDSYFLPNAAVFYQRDNWRAAINIKNLFNVNYIKSISGSRASGNQPGEPLTVIGSFSLRF